MELTDVQKLGLFSILLHFLQKEDISVITELNIKASEAAKLQAKLIEFMEKHGKDSNKMLDQAFTEASRALLYDIIKEG